MKNWIITGIFLTLMVVFACLKFVWANFLYFALACIILICMFWVIQLSLYYYIDYYKDYEDDFKNFKAEIINSKNITQQEFDDNIDFYIKLHKKNRSYYKVIDIFKILFVLVIMIISIAVIR